MEKGEAIPSLVGEAVREGEGSWKTRWSAKPTEGLQYELSLLWGRLIDAKDAITSEQATKVDDA